MSRTAALIVLVLLTAAPALPGALPFSAEKEMWTGTIDLHQGDTGTIEFSLENGLIAGKIIVHRGDNTIETPIQGEWADGSITFNRTLSATSYQPFRGTVTVLEAGHVTMAGQFAAGFSGTWSGDCSRAEAGAANAAPAAPSHVRVKDAAAAAGPVAKSKDIRAKNVRGLRRLNAPDFRLLRTIDAPKEHYAGAEDVAGYTKDYGLTTAFDFDPAGGLLVAVIRETSGPTRLFAFDMETGATRYKVVITDDRYADIKAIKLSPDGKLAAVPMGKVREIGVWDARSGALLTKRTTDGDAGDVDWHPNGALLAVVAGRSVELWDAGPNSLVRKRFINASRSTTEWPMAARWSPDGAYLAIGTNTESIYIADGKGTRQSPALVPRPRGAVYAVDWNTDGTRLAAAGFGSGSDITVWDNPQSALDSPASPQYALKDKFTPPQGQWWGRPTWDPTGTMIAFGDSQSHLFVRDASTGALLKTFTPHPQSRNVIARWKGDYLVTVGDYPDKDFKIWKSD
jgi:WD40 repeat protein